MQKAAVRDSYRGAQIKGTGEHSKSKRRSDHPECCVSRRVIDVEDVHPASREIGRQDVSSLLSSLDFEFGEYKFQLSEEKAHLRNMP